MCNKIIITRYLLITILGLVVTGNYLLFGQDTVLTAKKGQDSSGTIKQLLQETFFIQLQQSASWQTLQQGRLKGLLNDSVASDSLFKAILGELQSLRHGVINNGKELLKTELNIPKQLLQQHLTNIINTSHMREMMDDFMGVINKPVLVLNGGRISVEGRSGPSIFNFSSGYAGTTRVEASLSLMGIPLQIQQVRQNLTDAGNVYRNNFSFQFDKDAYLNTLKKRISGRIDPQVFIPKYSEVFRSMETAAMARLRTTIDSLGILYKALPQQLSAWFGNPRDWLSTDVASLREKLRNPVCLQALEQKILFLGRLKDELDSLSPESVSVADSIALVFESLKGKKSVIEVIRAIGKSCMNMLPPQLEKAGGCAKLLAEKNETEQDKVVSMAKEQLDLTGIQKFFLNINKLSVGINTLSMSPLTIYQYTNNGLNASFLKNNTYLFLVAAQERQFAHLFEAIHTNQVFNSDNSIVGIRVGKGDITTAHAHLSFFRYKEINSHYNTISMLPLQGSTAVITFSHHTGEYKWGSGGLEISKSQHQYANENNLYNNLPAGNNSITKQFLNTKSWLQQMAFSVQASGSLPEKGIIYDFHGRYAGKEYNNPGSLSTTAGMMELGGSYTQSLLKGKLHLNAKGNYRSYDYGGQGSRWRMYNFYLQARIKFKKSQYISIRYQPTFSGSNGFSNRFSVEANARKRFGKITYQQTTSFSVFTNKYFFNRTNTASNGVLLTSVQTITTNKRIWIINVQYNKADAADGMTLFDAELNAGAGFMYNIAHGISGSTTFYYNSERNWYRRGGCKQTINGQIGDRLIMSLYADVGKKCKEYRQSALGGNFLSWSIQYLIK